MLLVLYILASLSEPVVSRGTYLYLPEIAKWTGTTVTLLHRVILRGTYCNHSEKSPVPRRFRYFPGWFCLCRSQCRGFCNLRNENRRHLCLRCFYIQQRSRVLGMAQRCYGGDDHSTQQHQYRSFPSHIFPESRHHGLLR